MLDGQNDAPADAGRTSAQGKMAHLIAERDWSDSPLGDPAGWPQSLKTAVGLMLPAAAQIVLFWGPEFVALYNDAYAPTIGDKHPRALGRPARENWSELWDDLAPLLQSVRDTGETVYAKDRPFYIERHGYPETVYFDISYSAVPDEDGDVGGILCIVSETTERVLSEQRSIADRDRLTQMFDQSPTFTAMLRGPDHVFEVANSAYLKLVGHRDVIGKSVREALPDVADQGFFELLDEVYQSGQPFVGLGTRVFFDVEAGKREDRFVDFIYQPIVDLAGNVSAILVQGSDVTERRQAETLRDTQRQVLELAMKDTSLEDTLATLIRTVEEHSTAGVLASVLLMDKEGKRLQHAAAPSLPTAYNEAIDGIEIGPSVGSCGTAAFRKKPVYVDDIATDPLWDDFRELALSHKLRACWSTPIKSGAGDVLGTFAMYYREPRKPTSKDLELVDFVTRSAALVIERKQAEEALREESHNLEVLNRTGAAIASELDLERVVQLVTDAGVELTGAQFGAFFYNVVNPNGESYMLYTLSGVPRSKFERFGMPRNTQVFDATFSGAGIVRSNDITKDPRYGHNPPHNGMPKGHLPVVSYLAVPVISRGGEVIGGLFFGHPEPDRFLAHHERLMEGIAAQAAIAIDNARLYRDAQHEIDQRMKAEQALTALNETLESRVAEEIGRRSQAEEELRQAQKMETVGQLSGGIAHDFNNLLQVIHGNLSILERAIPKEEARLQRSVANALSGTDRAAALTKRLLAFSRRQPLDARPIDINRLILDMSELVHRTIGETIVIETRLSGDVPNALVDPNQLENAILNLAINARDAMPGGGRLEICTGTAQLERDDITNNPEARPGRYVRVTVRDSGHGMSEEVLARAVEPFFSTKEVGQGTGLGLSMVYGFVRQSGGHLVLNSREGSGTTVELYLPCSEAAAQSRPSRRDENELPRGRGERVLLCEDDDDVRFFSSETLRDLGYEVIEARDASSALAALMDIGRVDLLFTDVVLPGGKTGADLAREARKVQPELKVLFTTGYARSALDKEQEGEKGIELLLKPFGVEELANKIRQILG